MVLPLHKVTRLGPIEGLVGGFGRILGIASAMSIIMPAWACNLGLVPIRRIYVGIGMFLRDLEIGVKIFNSQNNLCRHFPAKSKPAGSWMNSLI